MARETRIEGCPLIRQVPRHSSRYLWLPAAAAVLMLAACAGPPPAPENRAPSPPAAQPDAGEEVQQRVREPARQESAGVQVYPFQNPAVKSLLQDAQKAEAAGNYDSAAISLERAMRIQPHDPEILQTMAEIQLLKKDYEQALNFAIRSYDSGSRVGEICARNWHTISVARERLGDARGSAEASQRAGQCMNAKPPGY